MFGDVEEPRGAGSGRGSPTPSGLASPDLGASMRSAASGGGGGGGGRARRSEGTVLSM